MYVRVRRHNDGVVEIGGAQRRVLRTLQSEVDQPVIDEIDGLALGQ